MAAIRNCENDCNGLDRLNLLMLETTPPKKPKLVGRASSASKCKAELGGWVEETGGKDVGLRRRYLWDICIGVKGIGTAGQHCGSKIAHDRLSLEVQVSEHFVGAPAA